jgi:hypothetical protein
VLQCDFLELNIGAPNSAEVTSISDHVPPGGGGAAAGVGGAAGAGTVASAGGGGGDMGGDMGERDEGAAGGGGSGGGVGGGGGGGGLTGPPVKLEALPAGCANAVVMSLVLSYVPTPRQRGEMIRRARELLAGDGRGLLLLITPHSTDKVGLYKLNAAIPELETAWFQPLKL